MTAKFEIVVRHQGGAGASAGRGSSQGQSAAAALEKQAKAAEAAAKKAASATEREAKRASDAQRRYALIQEAAYNKAGAAQARAAKQATDAAIREARRAADAHAREAKRAADAEIREARRSATARDRLLKRIGRGVVGAGTSIGHGAVRAAGSLGAGVSSAASGIASGGIGGVLGSVPRAAGDLLGGVGQAAADVAKGFGTALGKLLPGALGFIGKAVGNAFAVVGDLAGALGQAAGQIAGFIGDKLGLALKVSLGVAVGVGIAGIAQALQGDQLSAFFERFAAASGKTAKDAIDDLKAATEGLISTNDLLLASNRAFLNDSVENVAQFQELAKYADAFGDAIGQRPVEALETLTNALGTFQTKGLKKVLGSTVDFEKAFEGAAAAQGLLANELNDSQKHAIAYDLVLGALRKRFDGLSKGAGQASDAFDRTKATVSDTLGTIGRSLLPALQSVLGVLQPIAAAVGKFFENNNKEIAEAISKATGGILGNLKDLPTLIANIKLDEVFEVGGNAAEELWLRFKAGAQGSMEYVGGKLQELSIKYALLIGFLTGGPAGVLAAAAGKVAAHVAAGGGAFDDENAAEVQGRNRAANATFTPQGADAQRIADLQARRSQIGDNNRQRAATVPPAQPTQGPPTQTLASPGVDVAVEAVNAAGQRVASALDGVATVTGNARRDLAKILPGQIAAKEKELDAYRDAYEGQQRAAQQARKQADDIASAHKREGEAREQIVRELEASAEQVRQSRDAQIAANNQALSQRQVGRGTSSLVADAQSVDETDGLPLTVVKALRKIKKRARKAKFEGIRDDPEFAGASSNNLADDPERLNRILGRSKARESKGANATDIAQTQAANDQVFIDAEKELARLATEAAARKEKIATEIAAALDESKVAHAKEIELDQAQIDKAKEFSESMKDMQKEIADLKKQLAAIPAAPGR